MPRKVVFVDRDGTINVDHVYVSRPEDWEFVHGAPEAIKLLRDAGYSIALVTNQSGIGRGLIERSDFWALHGHVQQLLAQCGTCIDAVAVCPHMPSACCSCRKPLTGMATQIEAALGEPIDYPESWMIGDKITDVQFGQALGTSTALIRSRYWNPTGLDVSPVLLADSLDEAARAIAADALRRR